MTGPGTADFTTLPARAIEDSRLTALDLRALALIGWHDRRSMVRGGSGCFAEHAGMAARLGVDATSFSRTLSRLVSLGYVVRERQGDDRRRKTLRVTYEAETTCPAGQLSREELDARANYRPHVVAAVANKSAEIVDIRRSKTRRIPPKTGPQEISLREIKDAQDAPRSNARVPARDMVLEAVIVEPSPDLTAEDCEQQAADLELQARDLDRQGKAAACRDLERQAHQLRLHAARLAQTPPHHPISEQREAHERVNAA